MKRLISAVLAGALVASTAAIPAFAQAPASMPTIFQSGQSDAGIEQVQRRHHYRGGPGYYRGGGYYGGHRRHHRGNYGAAAAAGIIGLGVGAAIAADANRDRYYRDSDRDAYCFSRYRSYDPRTGTFLGNDGYRHPCR